MRKPQHDSGFASSAGFAGAILFLGGGSEGGRAPSELSPGHMFITDLPNSTLAVM